MRVSGILLFILILSGFSALRCGATVYPSNGTAANVQSIHNNQAQNGDTITLPAGTFNWTTAVTITKKITIQGQTTTQAPASPTCNDATSITDNVVVRNQGMFNLIGGDQRVTGITFKQGATTLMDAGVRCVGTQGHPSRVDHCHFDHPYFGPSVLIAQSNWMVIDHNTFTGYGGNLQPGLVHSLFEDYDGKGFADGVWEKSAGFGGPDFVFVEDNYIDSGGTYALGTNCFDGGKIVFRHNKCMNTVLSTGNHGLSRHGGVNKSDSGGRATEFYNNEMHWARGFWGMDGTDGNALLMHDNTWDGNMTWIGMNYYRQFYSFGTTFGGATGANPWDYNVTEPDGTHVDGHPPFRFDNGTLTAVADQTQVTDSTKNWPVNKWVGYNIRKTGDNNKMGAITGNTNNTLTIYGFIQDVGWAVGTTYEIYKVARCMDQPGLGRRPPINRASPAWPNQDIEPCYQWNNVFTPTGENLAFMPSLECQHFVLEGVHYFNNTPMPGYVPYTYPHPLVVGGNPPPPPPSPPPSPTATPRERASEMDFNNDGKPDYLLYNSSTRQTVIWYLNNNVLIGHAYGPTPWPGWSLVGVGDFNGDGKPDYLLYNSSTRQTVIWYLNNNVLIGHAYGPTPWQGWSLVGVGDFNGDGKSDYLLYNSSTRQTVIWYLNRFVLIGHAYGPTLWPGWSLVGVGDFNGDGKPDYLLYNSSTRQTVIWYLNNNVLIGHAYGPTPWQGWSLVGVGDFNGDGKSDYLFYNSSTRQTVIWYLNRFVLIGHAYGPTLWQGWSLVAP